MSDLLPALDAPLPAMDTAGRIGRLREELTGADALVVTSLTNIRYLTGFTGSAGLLLVLEDDIVLVTDGRYGTQSAEQLAASRAMARVEIGGAPEQSGLAQAAVGAATPRRLGLEASHISWARQRSFASDWSGTGPGKWTSGGPWITRCAASVRKGRRSRRSSPPVPTRPSLTTARATGGSKRTNLSLSTSAPSVTGTART
jgi:hypothetical protein